ncbi:MAG: insulinase family protein, partial [Lachnospiraceae bacterium]|nr:insulinase family protein [Lachnospiraceae bacterium]
LIDLTCDEEGFEKAKTVLARLGDMLKEAAGRVSPAAAGISESRPFCSPKAFTISGNVAYNALAADLKAAGGTFTGALDVLSVILRTDYLWNSVRGRCGAYDAMCGFARNGSMYLASYRDPGIRETYKIFEETADYIETFDASPRDMTKYIIGAVSEKDKPLTPSLVGLRSLAAYMAGISYEEAQQRRDEMLDADAEAVRALAKVIRQAAQNAAKCTIGSERSIRACEGFFESIEPLGEE